MSAGPGRPDFCCFYVVHLVPFALRAICAVCFLEDVFTWYLVYPSLINNIKPCKPSQRRRHRRRHMWKCNEQERSGCNKYYRDFLRYELLK